MRYDAEYERLIVAPLREMLADMPPQTAAVRELTWGAKVAECESHLRRIEMFLEEQDERLEALAYAIANI